MMNGQQLDFLEKFSLKWFKKLDEEKGREMGYFRFRLVVYGGSAGSF